MWRDQLGPIDNIHARRAELERLAPIEGPELLISTFADPYGPIRLRAAELLSSQMTPALSVQLVDAAQGSEDLGLTDNETTRSAVCLSLAAANVDPRAQEFLVNALNNDSDEVKYHAVVALHLAANEVDFKAPILDILESAQDAGLLVVAAQVAAFRGWTALTQAVVSTRDRVRTQDRFQVDLCLGELAQAGADIPAALRIEILTDIRKALKDEETLAAALLGLVAWNDQESIALIKKAANKWRVHPLLKVDAARALYLLGDSEGLEQLGKHLRSRRLDARGYTIDVVGLVPIPELFESVAAIANSEDPLADQAVEALSAFGERGAEVLKTVAATHTDSEIRVLAAGYLP